MSSFGLGRSSPECRTVDWLLADLEWPPLGVLSLPGVSASSTPSQAHSNEQALFQASASIKFVTVPLAKASHEGDLRVRVGGDHSLRVKVMTTGGVKN